MYEAMQGHNSESLTVFRGPYINISFQDGPIKEQGVNGTTNEEVIQLLIDRIRSLNVIMHSTHNEGALDFLEAAKAELNLRTHEREERGVEGTSRP